MNAHITSNHYSLITEIINIVNEFLKTVERGGFKCNKKSIFYFISSSEISVTFLISVAIIVLKTHLLPLKG